MDKVGQYREEKILSTEFQPWLYKYIINLPFNNSWHRKDIYHLVKELIALTGFDDVVPDILYDIEADIVGNCSEESIVQYPHEPDKGGGLVIFVRDYHWLDK